MWFSKVGTAVCVLALTVAAPVHAAKGYKCHVQTPSGSGNVTFKNGRARVPGMNAEARINEEGDVVLNIVGAHFVLKEGGKVLGRSGQPSGKHKCDMAQVRAQF